MPRKSITNQQRKALRSWFFAQSIKPTQKACTVWFEGQFGHRISQSTVSESLSDHFQFLDESQPSASTSEASRQRTAQWPILEAILFDWQRSIEDREVSTSGELLLLKAHEIWPQIPQYSSLETPEFSQGWLS